MTARSHVYALSTLAAAALVVPVQSARAQLVSVGIMAGGSLSTFTGDLASDIKHYAGFIGGGFVRVGLAGFAVQPGIYYTTKGTKSSDFSETTGQGSRTTLGYIQIPIVIRLRLGPLYVGAGPAIGFKLGCKIELAGSSNTGDEDCGGSSSEFTAKSTEVTGILEAGLVFGKFSLGGRADVGISNAIEAINTGSTANLTYKTRTVSAVAAIRF